MISTHRLQRAALVSLAISVAVFALGAWLLRNFSCQSHGPNAFVFSLLFCTAAFGFLGVSAFRRRSLSDAAGALAVALLGGALLFASIGLALPGCSGV